MSNGDPARQKSTAFHFLAGLTTGVTSAALLQPADLLKTRVQQSRSASLGLALREITRGPSSLKQLWRGTLPSVIRTGFGSALYFSSLNTLRQLSIRRPRSIPSTVPTLAAMQQSKGHLGMPPISKPSNIVNLTTGALARVFAGFVMMPVTVIKVRYESSYYSYKSIVGAGAAILRTEGVKGLFAGSGATAVRDAPYAGLYVLFYEQLKTRLAKVPNLDALTEAPRRQEAMIGSSMYTNFLSGVVAAGFATTVTNPFDAVKTRLQLMPKQYGNMVNAAKRMVREEGFKSLFDGLGLRIGRKALSSALTWTLYEELIRRAQPSWENNVAPIV